MGSAISFSFPLCGSTQEDDWTQGEVMQFLSRQVIEFSHLVGDTECKDLLIVFWGLAKFTFLASSDPKLRHLIVYLIVD